MKRALSGIRAEETIQDAPVPTKTATYTPIPHQAIMDKIRLEFAQAGFFIHDEHYRCSKLGDVALGNFVFNYKTDGHLRLSATFVNSYNKQYRFRFALGGSEVTSNNTVLIENGSLGVYKRVHTGGADILVDNSIASIVAQADQFWTMMLTQKELMVKEEMTEHMVDQVIGNMFRNEKMNSVQMTQLKNQLGKPSFDYGVPKTSVWFFYNCMSLAMRESHPAVWIDGHHYMHNAFVNVLCDRMPYLAGTFEPISAFAPTLTMTPAEVAIEQAFPEEALI